MSGDPKRVFLVVWWLNDFGGMERHVTELAVSLKQRGIQVHVFSENPIPLRNQYRRRLAMENIPFWAPRVPKWLVDSVHRSPQDGILDRLHWKLLTRFRRAEEKQPGDGFASEGADEGGVLAALLRRKLEREMKHGRPDVVHVHGFRLGQPWVVPWAKRHQLPVVYTEHSTIGDWGGPYETGAPTWINEAGVVACVSEQSRLSLAVLLPDREMAVHGHIVRQSKNHGRSGNGHPLTILSVARLRSEKGIDILLRAAAMVRHAGLPFRLRIVGDGDDRKQLEALRDDLGLRERVTFLGHRNSLQIERELQNADMFVLASRSEALPVALLEAMSAGLAVIATQVGGVPEVLRDGAGVLVPPDSVDALADALINLLRDDTERSRLRSASQKAFASSPHSEERAVAAILESYARAKC